jgi:hypothetical protein
VAVNCSTNSATDIEVIGNFTKLRFKPTPHKSNVNVYLVREGWTFFVGSLNCQPKK